MAKAKTKWEDIPIDKTDSGIAIRLDTIYYYPFDKNPAHRGHGYVTAEGAGVNVPFEDEIELLEGISRIFRRAKQIAAKA
jgi:hypothetical protein